MNFFKLFWDSWWQRDNKISKIEKSIFGLLEVNHYRKVLKNSALSLSAWNRVEFFYTMHQVCVALYIKFHKDISIGDEMKNRKVWILIIFISINFKTKVKIYHATSGFRNLLWIFYRVDGKSVDTHTKFRIATTLVKKIKIKKFTRKLILRILSNLLSQLKIHWVVSRYLKRL